MICFNISHEKMGSYRNWPPLCIIFSDFYKVEEHYCGVAGCNKGKRKICAYVIVQDANCERRHSANSNQCTQRHKAEINTGKNKTTSKDKRKIVEHNNKQDKTFDKATLSLRETSFDSAPVSSDSDIEIDLKPKSWRENEEEKGSNHNKISEKTDYSEKF